MCNELSALQRLRGGFDSELGPALEQFAPITLIDFYSFPAANLSSPSRHLAWQENLTKARGRLPRFSEGNKLFYFFAKLGKGLKLFHINGL